MKKITLLASSSLVICLTGCLPLQQAPLVYSSKISVGIDVSATSTETPGMGINIGYKQVDAAYVPVAVAKRCEFDNPAECSKDIYKLQLVNGANTQQDQVAPTEAQLAATSKEVARTAEQVANKQKLVQDASAKYDADKKLSESVATLTSSDEAIQKNAASTAEAKQNSSAALAKAIAAKNNLSADQTVLDAAKAERDSAVLAAAQAYTDYQKALSATKAANQNLKNDAFSVFGTFNASPDTSAKKDQVSVQMALGKVFSTGIASQNLTEGLKLQGIATATADCLEKANTLVAQLNAADRKAAIDKLIDVCQKQSSIAMSSK